MDYYHFVLRARHGHRPFENAEVASLAWRLLARQVKGSLAGVLMPNHLHLIAPLPAESTVWGMAGAVAGYLRERALWEPIPPPELIPDRHHLRRQVRYVALNPPRRDLCRDPLEWKWSTYRDLFGAGETWVDVGAIDRVFGPDRHALHRYVSSDPSVDVAGTPPPSVAAKPVRIAVHSLDEIAEATVCALRVERREISVPRSLARAVFIKLAVEQGWGEQGIALQTACEIDRRGLYKAIHRELSDASALSAARVCLGERRFRFRLR